MRGPQRPVNLPGDVKALLDQGQENEAAALLRKEQPWIDNKAMMRAFFDYKQNSRKTGFYGRNRDEENNDQSMVPRETWTTPYALVNLAGVLAFFWALLNIFVLMASLIILNNLDGYRETQMQVIHTYYISDSEDGVSWAITGMVEGHEMRLSDNKLLPDDIEYPGRYLQQTYPAGAVIPVLYNPDVTDDAFQGRTVNLIAFSGDPAGEEKRRIHEWMIKCIPPFLFFVFLSWLMRKTMTTTVMK